MQRALFAAEQKEPDISDVLWYSIVCKAERIA